MLSVLVWWLAAVAVGLVVTPMALWIFRNLPDRGYAFARPLGLIVVGYLFWLGGTSGLLHNTRVAILFVPEPAVPARRRALYSEELHDAARVYKGTFVRVDALEEKRLWLAPADGGPRRALARYPNEEGHAAVADAVLDRILP